MCVCVKCSCTLFPKRVNPIINEWTYIEYNMLCIVHKDDLLSEPGKKTHDAVSCLWCHYFIFLPEKECLKPIGSRIYV